MLKQVECNELAGHIRSLATWLEAAIDEPTVGLARGVAHARIDAARAALIRLAPPAEKGEMCDVPYYLIERNDRGYAEWMAWRGLSSVQWVTDASLADRYERQIDASRDVYAWTSWGIKMKVTEHLDIAPPATKPEGT